jgi:uncharacterized membrane protein (DUF106 family)
MAKEHKAAKLDQAVKAVSNRAKLAVHEQDIVKEKEQAMVESLQQGQAEIQHMQKQVSRN